MISFERMNKWPELSVDRWRESYATLVLYSQIVGKIRLALTPKVNQWWNVPLYLTARGLTTSPMAYGDRTFSIDFDFIDHQLRATRVDGKAVSFPLYGQSVASFHGSLVDALRALGVQVRIDHPYPFDLPDAGRPFAEDTEHATYDPAWVSRYWQVLSQVNLVLEEFAAAFAGKASPVHHFWHTFDIAYTRFSDRRVDQPAQVDPVTREAYSREVISFGFWFGDDAFPEPAFYSYTAPEPPALTREPLAPGTAQWVAQRSSHLAVLRYDDARAEPDPRAAVLAFYDSAYRAGALHAGWDTAALACPGGITDPHHPQDPPAGRAQPG